MALSSETVEDSAETGTWLSSRMAADEKIRQFETNNNLFELTLDNWCIWPVLRFQLFSRLESVQANKQITAQPLKTTQKLRFAFNDLVTLLRLPTSRYAVLVQPSNRSEKFGEKYKDIYFDDLLATTRSFIKIENLVNRHYLARGNSAFLPSHLTNAGIQLGVAAALRLPTPASIPALASHLSEMIIRDLGLNEYSEQRIATNLANFYWSKRLYKCILARIKPNIFLLTTAYSNHAMVAAAKELQLPVVEFQHGLIDRFHNGYSYTQAALKFKQHLPLPDTIFLYGQYWANELTMRGFWGKDLVAVGSLRMDHYRQKVSTRKGSATYTLVITTQNVDIQPLIDFIQEYCRLAGEDNNYQISFKLHPAENDKSRYLSAFQYNPRVQIYLGTEAPSTYELLAGADLHASIYSTCHYEALALGVPTIILPFTNHQTVLHLVNSGGGILVKTPQDLVDLVATRDKIVIPKETGEYYFKSGAIKNMLQALSDIDRAI